MSDTGRMHFTSRGNRLASAGLSVGVSVDPEAGTVTLLAPLYRRSLLLPDIASVCTHEDDGLNHGFVNWVVTGRAKSPRGVRLSAGGKGRVDIATRAGNRYAVVVDLVAQARQIAHAIERAQAFHRE